MLNLTCATRDMLCREIARLEEEARRFYRADGSYEVLPTAEAVTVRRIAAAGKMNDLEADNERLRAACRMILDRSRPIPSVEPGERDVGVAAYLSRAEYAIVAAACGGYPDVPGERGGADAGRTAGTGTSADAGRTATVRTAWGPVEVGE